MNKHIVKGGLAGVAVLALAAGGSTFASWSDYDVLGGSQAGAEELALNLGEPNSQNFDNMKLAPGVGSDYEFVVTSRTGEPLITPMPRDTAKPGYNVVAVVPLAAQRVRISAERLARHLG